MSCANAFVRKTRIKVAHAKAIIASRNQTSPDGTKQIILYCSLRGTSPSNAPCRYHTIASPTGFSVLITASGGTGYQSPSMGTQY
jgi:hypothetical protein